MQKAYAVTAGCLTEKSRYKFIMLACMSKAGMEGKRCLPGKMTDWWLPDMGFWNREIRSTAMMQ